MKKPNTFWLNLRFSPQEKILVWYCKSGHKPWMGQSSVLQGNIYYGLVRFPFLNCFFSIYIYIHRLTNDTMLLSENLSFQLCKGKAETQKIGNSWMLSPKQCIYIILCKAQWTLWTRELNKCKSWNPGRKIITAFF